MNSFSDVLGQCGVECERGHIFEPPCQYRLVPANVMYVVWVDQTYANYVADPEAVFTTREKAERYVERHHAPKDCRVEMVPVDPGPLASCPDCGGTNLAVPGTLDYQMTELGPDSVRHEYCFDCGWARYESGRIQKGSR